MITRRLSERQRQKILIALSRAKNDTHRTLKGYEEEYTKLREKKANWADVNFILTKINKRKEDIRECAELEQWFQ